MSTRSSPNIGSRGLIVAVESEDTWVVSRKPSKKLGWAVLAVGLLVGAVVAVTLWPASTKRDSADPTSPATRATTTTHDQSTTTSTPVPADEFEILTDAVRLQPPSGKPTMVATFRGLLVWGSDAGTEVNIDAAQTRPLPPAPIEPRDESAAEWTGSELIVWGGQRAGQPYSDGAAYHLVRDEWRTIAPSPLEPGAPIASVWTGEEMIVWGLHGEESAAGAAYNPVTDQWRVLPDAPLALTDGNGVLLGGSAALSMVVLGSWLPDDGGPAETRALMYGIGGDEWVVLPSPDLLPQSTWLSWTGQELIAWDYSLEARRLVPGTKAWNPLPDIPLDGRECYVSGSSGTPVLVTYCDQAATFDPATGRWHRATIPGVVPDSRRQGTFGPAAHGSLGQVVLTTEGLYVLR